MHRIRSIIKKGSYILETIEEHQIGVYAAQAAYFFVLSMIPLLLLLLTMVRFTPATSYDVIEGVQKLFPSSVQIWMISIINQVYAKSGQIIPVTLLTALWSAGRGVLSVTAGLNIIYEHRETRNYIFLRLRATMYTVLFLVAIVSSLLLSVFGNLIGGLLYERLPILTGVLDFLLANRTILTFVVLTFFWTLVYTFLPNRIGDVWSRIRQQMPGAVFTACGWLLLSYIFSIYLDVFPGFSDMYGSMATLTLIMLWLYLCMYVILLGAEVNCLLSVKK